MEMAQGLWAGSGSHHRLERSTTARVSVAWTVCWAGFPEVAGVQSPMSRPVRGSG